MSGWQGLPSELPCPGWVPTVAQKTGLDRRPGALHWGFLGASVIFLAPEEPDTSLPVKRQMYSTDWPQTPGGRGCAVHLVHLNLTCGQTQRGRQSALEPEPEWVALLTHSSAPWAAGLELAVVPYK